MAWCPETSTDAFFVTLNKDDTKHSATTMYRDYAISPELFHWESQNSTSPSSPVGKRYLDRVSHGSQILLFTRDTADDETGLTVPYTCLGQVDYVQHSGEADRHHLEVAPPDAGRCVRDSGRGGPMNDIPAQSRNRQPDISEARKHSGRPTFDLSWLIANKGPTLLV